MRLHSIIIIIFIDILFFLGTSNNALSDDCAASSEKQIENYIYDCKNHEFDSIQEIGFAPHKKKEFHTPGEFGYVRIKDRYPSDKFPLGDEKYDNKIWFYSSIKKGYIPKYIWHLIISPASENRQEGFLVNIDVKNSDLYKLGLLKKEYKKYLAKSYVESDNRLIYTNNEIDIRTDFLDHDLLNNVWINLIEGKNFKLIKCERTRKETSKAYDYTFYFHNINTDEAINTNEKYGYRIPSMKTITSPGKVYGFVLDENGSCLGHKTIKVE